MERVAYVHVASMLMPLLRGAVKKGAGGWTGCQVWVARSVWCRAGHQQGNGERGAWRGCGSMRHCGKPLHVLECVELVPRPAQSS